MIKMKKAISLLLAVLLIMSVVPVSATNEANNSVGSIGTDYVAGTNGLTNTGNDTAQGQVSNSQTLGTTVSKPLGSQENIEVYVTKASTYIVTIPKTVILSGNNGVGQYAVKIEGDLAGTEVIKVKPDASFLLKQAGKTDITAYVKQDKIIWQYADLETNGVGTITVEGLSAGIWQGSFKFTINRTNELISVSAIDETDKNLNATATMIIGEQKTTLLSNLENDTLGYTAADVSAIIDVTTDSFAGKATATFDVSNIAEDGDKIIIIHFNNETQKWEYIATETVVNGIVTADFNSFSPVAFLVNAAPYRDPALNHENIIPEGGVYYSDVGLTYEAGDSFPVLKANYDMYEYNGLTYTLKNRTGHDSGADTLEDAREFMKQLCKLQTGMSWEQLLTRQNITEDEAWREFGLTEELFVPAAGGEWMVEATVNDTNILQTINGLPVSVTIVVKIPEGGVYTDRSTGQVKEAGEAFPLITEDNDIYTFGDYEYRYNATAKGWRVLLNTKVTNKNKTTYGEILDYINGCPVTDLDGLFSDCKYLTTAPELPSTAIDISNMFGRCTALTEAPIIPDGVQDMSSAFQYCKNLKNTPNIPDSVTSLQDTFYNCTALSDCSNFSVPNGVTNMTRTFYECNAITDLSHVVISGSVTDLDNTFYNCTALTHAPVLSEGTTILRRTFYGCTSLIVAPIIPNSVTFMSGTFIDCTNLKTYYGSTDADGDFSNYKIPDNVTSMDSVFSDCTSLTNTPILPNNIDDLIGTFSGCTALTTITMLPNSVTSLTSTFSGCTALTTVLDIPDSVTSMSGTFSGCTSLKTAPKLSKNVTYLSNTFYNCTALMEAPVIPEGVTNMSQTFKGCSNLTKAPVIPDSVQDMRSTFESCSKLTKAPEIPESVTNMNWTFKNCTYLQVPPSKIPSNVETMRETFYYCSCLTGTIEFNANPSSYDNCFKAVDFSKVTLTGSSTMLDTIGKTGSNYIVDGDTIYPYGDYTYTYHDEYNGWNLEVKDVSKSSYSSISKSNINKNTTAMINTFANCVNMTTAPIIPNTVLYMVNTFENCTNLTGTITINANPKTYDNCFVGVDFQAQMITLAGESTILDLLGATGINYCAECNGYCKGSH